MRHITSTGIMVFIIPVMIISSLLCGHFGIGIVGGSFGAIGGSPSGWDVLINGVSFWWSATTWGLTSSVLVLSAFFDIMDLLVLWALFSFIRGVS